MRILAKAIMYAYTKWFGDLVNIENTSQGCNVCIYQVCTMITTFSVNWTLTWPVCIDTRDVVCIKVIHKHKHKHSKWCYSTMSQTLTIIDTCNIWRALVQHHRSWFWPKKILLHKSWQVLLMSLQNVNVNSTQHYFHSYI